MEVASGYAKMEEHVEHVVGWEEVQDQTARAAMVEVPIAAAAAAAVVVVAAAAIVVVVVCAA